jgi:hypothetical protein
VYSFVFLITFIAVSSSDYSLEFIVFINPTTSLNPTDAPDQLIRHSLGNLCDSAKQARLAALHPLNLPSTLLQAYYVAAPIYKPLGLQAINPSQQRFIMFLKMRLCTSLTHLTRLALYYAV